MPLQDRPPEIRLSGGVPDPESLADLVEWFLARDPKVAFIRHENVEELFQWSKEDDVANGRPAAPFENAESRFAVGTIQAIIANSGKHELHSWLTSVVEALAGAKETNEEIGRSYGLDSSKSHVEEAEKIPAEVERRIYLKSCWIEALCTAEARILGWVYQELHGEPFQPAPPNPESI